MPVTIDNVSYIGSHTHPGEPWRGWKPRSSPRPSSPLRQVAAANDNRPLRFRGGHPALKWLGERDPQGAAAIWDLRPSADPQYWDKGGKDDEGEWDGDGLGDGDARHRIHPRIEDLLDAASDGQAIVPKGKYANRTGPLRRGFPERNGQHHIARKWHRLGRAIFNVDSTPRQEGLLHLWLDRDGKVQLPRVQQVPREGTKIPLCWPVDRYLKQWFGTSRNASRCPELDRLYESECRDRHIRRRGTPIPPTIYGPSGHSRVDVPLEKAAMRDWLAKEMAGKPVTACPPSVARLTAWNGRVPGNKQGLSEPDIRQVEDEPIALPEDVALTVEAVLSRGSLTDVANAHGVDTTRPDRAGKRLVLEAAAAVLSMVAANDNKNAEKAAA